MTAVPATTTVVDSAAEATVEPPADAGESASTDESDSGDSNTAGELSTAVAARTPVPTPTSGPVEKEIDNFTAESRLAGRTILGLSSESWIDLGLSILIVIVGYFIVTAVLGRLFTWLVSKTSTQADNAIWAAIREDAKWLIVLLLVRYSFMRLDFLGNGVRMLADDLFFVIGITTITKMVLTLINLAVDEVRDRFAQQEAGDVIRIGTRSTQIRTGDHREVVLPNSKIVESEIVNYTFLGSNYRVQTDLGVAYGTDMEQARQTITETVRDVDGVLSNKAVDVFF